MSVRSLKSWIAVGVAAAVTAGGLVAGVAAAPALAAGCSPTSSVGTDTVLTFSNTTACSWTVPAGVTAADVLVVGGGGGGSALIATLSASGGGAGGLLYQPNTTLTPGDSVNVLVGTGGTADTLGVQGGGNGTSSTFAGYTAVGGGGGGLLAGSAGGSGGGAGFNVLSGFAGGAGTPGQGNAGGGSTTLGIVGGGSGGAGGGSASAASGTTPGAGTALTINGSSVTYAAGGSSLGVVNATPGGGGRAKASIAPAVADTGNAGTVIVRYRTPQAPVFTPPTPPPPAVVGVPYPYYVFYASGYPAPTYFVSYGALPPGLFLNATTGLLYGTPTGDGGTYQFIISARNSYGTVSTTIITIIIYAATTPADPIDAPTAPVAVAGVASFTAGWEPIDNAVSYTATASPGPSACTTADNSCVLGAVAGRTYTFTVVAHTTQGDSVVSTISNPVVPTTPPVPDTAPTEAPTTLTVHDSDTQTMVTTTTSGDDVTVIGTGFAANSTAKVVMYSTPDELKTVTTDSNGQFTTPVTVPDLEPGAHNFVATGVDPDGSTHRLRLPVTVQAASLGKPSLRLSRTTPLRTTAARVASVPCRLSAGLVTTCRITAYSTLGGRKVVVGRGSYTTASAQSLREVKVPVRLSTRLRKASARPSGAIVTFRAVVSQRTKTGTKTTQKTVHVVAKKYKLAHWVRFNAKSSKLSGAENRYLNSVYRKISGVVTSVRCVGHADEGTKAASQAMATNRAVAVCNKLAGATGAGTVIKTVLEPRLKGKQSALTKARQRRVDISITN